MLRLLLASSVFPLIPGDFLTFAAPCFVKHPYYFRRNPLLHVVVSVVSLEHSARDPIKQAVGRVCCPFAEHKQRRLGEMRRLWAFRRRVTFILSLSSLLHPLSDRVSLAL